MTGNETNFKTPEPACGNEAWRHALHQQPELGFQEHATADFIVTKLREFGIQDITTGVGKTGIVATLRGGSGNRSIAFRADMDALPIQEVRDHAYKSQTSGVMHACGHDGHITMLLGAAKLLSQTPDFDGIIHLIFQPSEENGKGMNAMLADGLLERFPFEEIYGLHNRPGMAVGRFATKHGAFMAAEDNFKIVIKGRGGHSGCPHDHNDALVTASATVMNLQNIVSRRIDPSQFSIVSVTEMNTDGLRNKIAGSAVLLGDVRSYDKQVSLNIEAELRRIAETTAAMFQSDVEVEYTREFIPLINESVTTKHALEAAVLVTGNADRVTGDDRRLGSSEDFAQVLEHAPGNFMNLGNGDSAALHNSEYDFDDDALPFGVQYYVELASLRLGRKPPRD